MDTRQAGILLLVIGVVAILVGVLALAGLLSWFGRLPGDIRIEGARTKIYAPIVSMLLVSAGLSLVLAIVRRFFS